MTEEWRAITSYEGLYEVSNLGRVRSLDRDIDSARWGTVQFRRGRVLCPGLDSQGYPQIQLCRNGRIVPVSVHRLVAIAFLGAPKEGRIQVNHKYGIKTDNRATELEWVTPKENTSHAFQVGLRV